MASDGLSAIVPPHAQAPQAGAIAAIPDAKYKQPILLGSAVFVRIFIYNE